MASFELTRLTARAVMYVVIALVVAALADRIGDEVARMYGDLVEALDRALRR